MNFTCQVSDCLWNDGHGDCKCPHGPTITDNLLSAVGFVPMCEDYVEVERKNGTEA